MVCGQKPEIYRKKCQNDFFTNIVRKATYKPQVINLWGVTQISHHMSYVAEHIAVAEGAVHLVAFHGVRSQSRVLREKILKLLF